VSNTKPAHLATLRTFAKCGMVRAPRGAVNGTNDEQTSKLMRYAVYHARDAANNLARAYYDLHKKAQFKK
jgi:hypothetical protein